MIAARKDKADILEKKQEKRDKMTEVVRSNKAEYERTLNQGIKAYWNQVKTFHATKADKERQLAEDIIWKYSEGNAVRADFLAKKAQDASDYINEVPLLLDKYE